MPKPKSQGHDSGNGEHEAHPVYSDFVHLGSLSDLGFAVALREEPGSDILQKILPLTKVIPKAVSEPRQKKKKSPPKPKKVESAICERADCAARKDQLADLKGENAGLRSQFKAIEAKLVAAKNRKALIEKGIQISLEKNDTLKNQIDSTQSRIETIDVELEKGDLGSEKIRGKIAGLQSDIEAIRQKIEKDAENIRILNEMKSSGTMKFSRSVESRENMILAMETKNLDLNDPDYSDEEDAPHRRR
jgi:chromosome segregation ATPase